MPSVTVLLPVFNGERFLAEAIRSVLAQTFTDFELLILDDGSTDRTAEIAQGFADPRIRYLRNDTNLRLIRTLNRGLREARGELIARMDADDVCFPERLQLQAEYLKANPQVAVIGSYAVRIDENGRRGRRIRRPQGAELAATAWLPTPVLHPTVMLRRSLVEAGFLFDENALHCEDYELWLRILHAGHRIENLPRPLLYYRMHAAGVSNRNRELQLRNSYSVFKRAFPASPASYEEFVALAGAGGGISWKRRRELLRALSPGERISGGLLARQLAFHAKGLLGLAR